MMVAGESIGPAALAAMAQMIVQRATMLSSSREDLHA
jgi:hypothetical protein